MSWVKLDDRIFDNPKIAALSDAAKVAYLEATCYCARELTDGFIPMNKAKALAGKPRVIQELIPQLWEPTSSGFRVHDYLKYNPTREQVVREREAAKRRMSGIRSGEQTPEQQGEVHPPPVDPVNPDPPFDPENPPPAPAPEPLVGVVRPNIFGLVMDFFGPGAVNAQNRDELLIFEQEHPPECVEHCFERARLVMPRPKSFGYIKAMAERHRREGCDGQPNGADKRLTAASAHPNGVADRVPDVDRRSAAIADRRRRFGS